MSNSTKYRFLSMAVIAVMSIALAACGGSTANNTPGSGGSSSNGGGSTTTMNNADLLKAAAASMKAAKGYHIDASGSAAGQAITMTGDIDVAGNKSNLAISAAGLNINAVSIVSDTYLSTDGGKTFTKDTSGSVSSGFSGFTGMWNNFNPADVDKSASALKDGSPATDNINGTNCHHITGNLKDLSSLGSTGVSGSSGATATPTDGTVDIWAANDGSSVCQMKVTTTDGSTNLTIKWSNINGTFNITAPPASSTTGGTGGAADMTATPGQ